MEELVCAAEGGDVVEVERILRYTADRRVVNAFDSMGYAPIHYATTNGHKDVAKVILDFGGDVNLKNPTKGQTPLHCACNGCHLEVVKLLLSKPEIISSVNAVTKKYKYTPLHCVAASGKVAAPVIIGLLLRHGALVDKLDATGATPFMYACRRGDSIATVRALLKCRTNVALKDKNGATAMHMAAIAGNADIIRLLAHEGLSPNGDSSPNSPMPPLHLAAKHGHAGAVVGLLRLGARPDRAWTTGRRALHMAAYAGHIAVIEALVRVKADVDAQDADEYTPVAYAAFQGHQKVIAVLVKAGANLLISPKKTGLTPLHLAAKEGQRHAAAVLALASSAALHATDKQGRTALHFAALRGDINMAHILLRAGADATVKDKKKHTPAQVAASKGHKALAQLLSTGVGLGELQRSSGMLTMPAGNHTARSATVSLHGRSASSRPQPPRRGHHQQTTQQQTSQKQGGQHLPAATQLQRRATHTATQHQRQQQQQKTQHQHQHHQKPKQQQQPQRVRHERPASYSGPTPPERQSAGGQHRTQRPASARANGRGDAQSPPVITREERAEMEVAVQSGDDAEDSRIAYLQGQLKTLEREESNMLANNTFPHVFASFRHIGRHHSARASAARVNVRKNRYGDIVAYDHTRVTVDAAMNEANSDYINANFISGYKRPRAYIACQGPLPNTARDFWQMVWEQDSALIVMVACLVEKNRPKCFKYWPSRQDGVQVFGQVQVSLTAESVGRDFTRREFKLKNDEKTRRVTQLQMTSWPDHGAPSNPAAFLNLHSTFNGMLRRHRSRGPAVIHCSAGVGRSGTFICMDILYEMALDGKEPLNIRHVISRLREQRNFMVQSVDQFRFLYSAVREMLTALIAMARTTHKQQQQQQLKAIPEGRSREPTDQGDEDEDDMDEDLRASPLDGRPHNLDAMTDQEQMELAVALSLSELEAPPSHDQPSYNSQPFRSQTLSLPVTFDMQYIGSQKVLKATGSSVITAALKTVVDRTRISRKLKFTVQVDGIGLKEADKKKGALYSMSLISCFQCGMLPQQLQARPCAVKQTAYLVFISYAPRKHVHVAHVFLAPSIDDVDEVNMYIAHAMEVAHATRPSSSPPARAPAKSKNPFAHARGASAASSSTKSRPAQGRVDAQIEHQTADELLEDLGDDDDDDDDDDVGGHDQREWA
ncbi:hypothetical protein PTSG_04513 [Salpingoeca rosetta]|uniref:protein-tyrosine-phosphatase n=1 Tax=Salpingoeca rosetta (strain ATCC 50818 / BSB-021) TaxID=946362 RepID=F2U8S8_SALR5|nr:uncharacterized protein PTSG_04513 [Salpingoeca rosetta]EGD72786.1 hypothetical protein PTSG_04513 [Salpingoeca rosetta]|eukprot:XP_004994609.1 hypothetical protein PTSG_04513 [Salpingoeca rosetta]